MSIGIRHILVISGIATLVMMIAIMTVVKRRRKNCNNNSPMGNTASQQRDDYDEWVNGLTKPEPKNGKHTSGFTPSQSDPPTVTEATRPTHEADVATGEWPRRSIIDTAPTPSWNALTGKHPAQTPAQLTPTNPPPSVADILQPTAWSPWQILVVARMAGIVPHNKRLRHKCGFRDYTYLDLVRAWQAARGNHLSDATLQALQDLDESTYSYAAA